jgi:hypothetical protein
MSIMLMCLFNLLKPSGYYTYHQVQHSKILHADYIVFMCSVWLSEETVPFPLCIINRWFNFGTFRTVVLEISLFSNTVKHNSV